MCTCSTLNSQWEEKVRVIDSLEENLKHLQESFSERERRLLLERDAALLSTRYKGSLFHLFCTRVMCIQIQGLRAEGEVM